MLLAFDLTGTQRGTDQGQHGGGEYIRSLMADVVRLGRPEDVVFVAVEGREHDPQIALLSEGFEVRTYRGTEGLSQLLADLKPDVFFSGLPYAYAKVRRPPGTRAVYTIHGLREIECPSDRYRFWYPTKTNATGYFKRWFDRLVPARRLRKHTERFRGLLGGMTSGDLIVAVSEHTRFSLLNHFGIIRCPVRVAYSPEVPRQNRGPAVGGPPYLLMVNGDRWIKNSVRAVLAFDDLVTRVADQLGPMVLRVTGGIPERARRRLKHPERVISMGYQTDEAFEALFADAVALFYPSLNEGFGYPPLEAMKYGTPVLSSAVASLTEVCGAGALFFDPRSIDEMQCRILAVLDPEVRARLGNAALARYQEVSSRQTRDKEAVVNILLGRSAGA